MERPLLYGGNKQNRPYYAVHYGSRLPQAVPSNLRQAGDFCAIGEMQLTIPNQPKFYHSPDHPIQSPTAKKRRSSVLSSELHYLTYEDYLVVSHAILEAC